ncbi:MAG: TetR family transcriptional regulator C-terminal domain-containing protein [Sneathiella sp.]|uniref:TetR family transcriptional regulator C-terminal domain-containing protein n=1 Tax=Sneathiella sp. TaxID=1964365 RepID=UPI0030035870
MAYLAKEERRETIFKAVLDVVAQKGFGGITARGVAAELGAATGIIHHHFDSLTDMKCSALLFAARQDLAANDVIFTQNPIGPALLQILDWRKIPESTSISRIWISAADEATRSPEFDAVYGKAVNDFHAQLSGYIRKGVTSGDLKSGIDPDLVAWKLVAVSASLSDFLASDHIAVTGDQVSQIIQHELQESLSIQI